MAAWSAEVATVGELLARYRGVLAVLALLLLPLVLLYAQTRDPSRRGPVVGAVVDLAGGIERGMLGITGAISDVLQKYVTSVAAQDELVALRRAGMAREVLEAQVRELELENIELRQLAGAAHALGGPRSLSARVIGRAGEPLSRIARIDRGRRDGLRRGDGVISSAGVVGRVLSTGAFASDVLLLTDPGSVIDVVVQRTRARGLVRGAGDEDRYLAKVEDFDRLAEVVPGDVLVTSGLDAHLPPGLHVATVESVSTRDDGIYKRADVVPAASLSTIEHVLILIRRDPPALPDVGGEPLAQIVCPAPYQQGSPEVSSAAADNVKGTASSAEAAAPASAERPRPSQKKPEPVSVPTSAPTTLRPKKPTAVPRPMAPTSSQSPQKASAGGPGTSAQKTNARTSSGPPISTAQNPDSLVSPVTTQKRGTPETAPEPAGSPAASASKPPAPSAPQPSSSEPSP